MEIRDYPETDHPPIEDIVDDSMVLRIENLIYPESDHLTIEEMIEI